MAIKCVLQNQFKQKSLEDLEGILPIESGGTSAKTAEAARSNLGAAPTESPVFTGTVSKGRKSGTTVGNNSIALGYTVEASGDTAFAEGRETVASGNYSHAEGRETVASGHVSHAEGYQTTTYGYYAHAEGQNTDAVGTASHSEGYYSVSNNNYSHAEGISTIATRRDAFFKVVSWEPSANTVTLDITHSDYALAAANVSVDAKISIQTEGYTNARIFTFTVSAFDADTGIVTVSESISEMIGDNSEHIPTYAVVHITDSNPDYMGGQHAEGRYTRAVGADAHAEGYDTIASGARSHAEGNNTTASGTYSHAEGTSAIASGQAAHAEGASTYAAGHWSHAEGAYSVANNQFSHAEGLSTLASQGNYFFKVLSWDVDANTITLDTSFNEYSAVIDNINIGSKISIQTSGYTNAQIFDTTITEVNGETGVIGVSDSISGFIGSSSSYRPRFGVVHASSYTNNYLGARHAEGRFTRAIGMDSHAEGHDTDAEGNYAHAEGYGTAASGGYAHSEGRSTTASGTSSHAEGYSTTASGDQAHAEGNGTKASGASSHAEGSGTKADKNYAHAEGYSTTASGTYSHAEGHSTSATSNGCHAEGIRTTASNLYSHAQGKYNKAMTTGGAIANTVGDAMVIGNGTDTSALSNAFRVTFAGAVYGKASYNSSGADYAEYFEWLDNNPNNEDRTGYFVTLDGRKIRKAEPGEYILGIISGNPCIIGNADEDWLGRWMHDEFGRYIKEDAPKVIEEFIEIPVLDEDGNETGEIRTEHRETVVEGEFEGWRYKANPDYDPTQAYIERKDRPEWSAVGMMGVLAVRDDGTCEVNGYAKVAKGGTATAAEKFVHGETYRVVERTAPNVVNVIIKC